MGGATRAPVPPLLLQTWRLFLCKHTFSCSEVIFAQRLRGNKDAVMSHPVWELRTKQNVSVPLDDGFRCQEPVGKEAEPEFGLFEEQRAGAKADTLA